MDTPLLIGVDLAAVAAVQLAALWVVGWPVRALLVGDTPERHHVAATPLIGLAVLQTAGWYSAMDAGGIRLAIVAVCAAGALASVAIGAWRLRIRGELHIRSAFRSVPVPILLAVATTLLFAFHHQTAYNDDPAVPITAGNNDIAAYAIAAEHLVTHGFDESGAVVGTHVGTLARHDVFGAYAFLVVGSAATGRDVWATLLPALLLGTYLCALSMYCVVRRCSNLERAPAALISVLSCASFLFVYLEVNYFLSQVVAMSTIGLLFVLAMDAARAPSLVRFLRTSAMAAALVLCTLFTYPHMVYLGVPVIIGLASSAMALRTTTWRDAARAFSRGAAMATAVVGLSFAVAPSRFVDAFHRTIALSDIPAGWPLPFVTPSQLLGFQRSWTPTPSRTTLVASVFLVVVALAAALVLRVRRGFHTEGFAVIVVGVLASYAAAYARYGVSYNQWKWISYFQPLLVVGLATPIVIASREIVRRLPPVTRLSRAAAAALASALLASAAVNARNASTTAVTKVDEHLLALEGHPFLHGLDGLNVDLQPYWQTMWGMYAAMEAGIDAVHPHSLSYYPRSPHAAEWTLRAADDTRPLLPGREARELNGGYDLVRYAPSPPAEGTYYVMGACFGLFRYTGGRWVALARTPLSGEYRFHAVVRPQLGRRDPVLVRGVTGRADIVGMRHLDGGYVAFFHEHVPGDIVEGEAVAFAAGTPAVLDVVLDETTGTVRVAVNGEVVLDVQRPLHRLGELAAAEGANDVGASVEKSFSGTLHGTPITTDTCRAAAARLGVRV